MWSINKMRDNMYGKRTASNREMFIGVLLGVLVYSFTGYTAAVIIGLLVGLILSKRNREEKEAEN